MTTNDIRNANPTIVDLKKVAYAALIYRSGSDYERKSRPTNPTVRGVDINTKEMAAEHKDFPGETMIERAKRLDIVDKKWIPVCILVMNNGHRLEKTGEKAMKIYEAYCAHIFGKQRGKNETTNSTSK